MKEQLKKAKAIIEGYDGPAVRVMEVCGTHTHEIFHLGVRKILPPQVELISGDLLKKLIIPSMKRGKEEDMVMSIFKILQVMQDGHINT